MTAADGPGDEMAAWALWPARLAQTASQLLGDGLGELVPAAAQRHLLNAQRELLLAVLLTVEHNASRASHSGAGGKRGGKRRSSSPRSRRPSRLELE